MNGRRNYSDLYDEVQKKITEVAKSYEFWFTRDDVVKILQSLTEAEKI